MQGTLIFKVSQHQPMHYGDYHYPSWANSLGWLVVAFPIASFFVGAFYNLYTAGGLEVSTQKGCYHDKQNNQ